MGEDGGTQSSDSGPPYSRMFVASQCLIPNIPHSGPSPQFRVLDCPTEVTLLLSPHKYPYPLLDVRLQTSRTVASAHFTSPAAWCPVWIHLQGEQVLPAISEEACPWVLQESRPLARGGWPSFLRPPVWLPQSSDFQLDMALQEIPSVPGEQEAQRHEHLGKPGP